MLDCGNMYSDLMNGENQEITDSDQNSAMMASNTFDRLLREIQSSNLNFQLQVSPFSAQISLKKSLVRERDGTYRHPVLPSISSPCKRQSELDYRKELDKLRHDYEEVNNDCALKTEELVDSKKVISTLEAKLAKAEAEVVKIFEERKSEDDIFKKQIKVLQKEIDDQKKEEKCLTKTIKEKDREAVKIQNKCDNLEANVKRLKSDVTVLRNEKKKLDKEKLRKSKVVASKAQMKSITPPSTVTALPALLPVHNNFLNNNDGPIEVCDDIIPVATASQSASAGLSCQSPVDSSSVTTPPQTPCTPPRHATPWLIRTPPDIPISNATLDLQEKGAAIASSDSTITVQEKLKEVIERGQKLDFASVVSLIKNHPWEESKEMVDKDDEYYHDDFENDYDGYASEEIDMKLEEI